MEVGMSSITSEEEDRIIDHMLLISAVHRLPPKQQVIVALRSAGYTQQECGDIVGMTRAAIGFIYKRAVRRLRQYMLEAMAEGSGKHDDDNA
jgi:RNA polymerase sigma factor (sigma-70 family)